MNECGERRWQTAADTELPHLCRESAGHDGPHGCWCGYEWAREEAS